MTRYIDERRKDITRTRSQADLMTLSLSLLQGCCIEDCKSRWMTLSFLLCDRNQDVCWFVVKDRGWHTSTWLTQNKMNRLNRKQKDFCLFPKYTLRTNVINSGLYFKGILFVRVKKEHLSIHSCSTRISWKISLLVFQFGMFMYMYMCDASAPVLRMIMTTTKILWLPVEDVLFDHRARTKGNETQGRNIKTIFRDSDKKVHIWVSLVVMIL
jgi:hypothetical protein